MDAAVTTQPYSDDRSRRLFAALIAAAAVLLVSAGSYSVLRLYVAYHRWQMGRAFLVDHDQSQAHLARLVQVGALVHYRREFAAIDSASPAADFVRSRFRARTTPPAEITSDSAAEHGKPLVIAAWCEPQDEAAWLEFEVELEREIAAKSLAPSPPNVGKSPPSPVGDPQTQEPEHDP